MQPPAVGHLDGLGGGLAGADLCVSQGHQCGYRPFDTRNDTRNFTGLPWMPLDYLGLKSLAVMGFCPNQWTSVDLAGCRCRLSIIRIMRRLEEQTSELQSLMRLSYAVFCL